ncbi:hypothetical protein CASFOL_038386 [Castilleja foliolosa]|uniref:dCMP deaminase n=1 Tax=Castilleja foliolosa TaxID=1961234 RepID=A0ABD3BKW5_9LAMI
MVSHVVAPMTSFLGLRSMKGDPLETKYPYVCHAEVNAILNTNHASAAGQKLYVTMFPCNECAKIIIQSGVSEVIYYVEKRLDNVDAAYVASHKLLSMAGVKGKETSAPNGSDIDRFEGDLGVLRWLQFDDERNSYKKNEMSYCF